jgi:hypothetical protein
LSGKTGVEWDALDLSGRFMAHWYEIEKTK